MTLLDPQADRTLYTEALTTPPDYRFDCAVALTYSLSLDTLLSVPLHLLLHADGRPQRRLLGDRVGLLDGLRQTAGRLSVFHQRGGILARGARRVLYSLLEDSVFHADAPRGGAFHPKVWLLRFRPAAPGKGSASEAVAGTSRNQRPDPPLLRLAVLSRNLTADPSCDVSLTVDGLVGTEAVPGNDSLVRLLRALPSWSSAEIPESRAAQVASLADDLAHTAWDLPDRIDELRLHALGLEDAVRPGGEFTGRRPAASARHGWLPPRSKRIAVVSPFCTRMALESLSDRGESPATLVSRSEELDGIPDATLRKFGRCLVLGELLEPDDGENASSQSVRRGARDGLHAKVYICDAPDDRTRLFVGSANATGPALLGGRNVEVMAELVGSRKILGSVDSFLDSEGFGGLLEDFVRSRETPVEPVGTRRMETAFKTLSKASLRLRCVPAEAAGATMVGDGVGKEAPTSATNATRWRLALHTDDPIALPTGVRATAWPITLRREHGIDAGPLIYADAARLRQNVADRRHRQDASPVPTTPAHPRQVVFGPMAVASLTRFIAFEIALTGDANSADADAHAPPHAFVLRIPADGMPTEERSDAVVRQVVRNRKGFLRYLLFLLGAFDGPVVPGGGAGGARTGLGDRGGLESLPLLEEMTRAFCRDPSRLDSVRRLVEHLQGSSTGHGTEIVPKDFLDLWAAFESALADGGRGEAWAGSPGIRPRRDAGQQGLPRAGAAGS